MNIKRIIKSVYTRLFNPLIYVGNGNIGKNVFIGKRALVTHRNLLVVGDNVRVGNDFEVRCFPQHGGRIYEPQVVIENNCYLSDHLKILCNDTVTIKENALIASDVLITTENHGMDVASCVSYGKQPLTNKPVTVGQNCWIGEKVVILPGVTIGEWAVVAAGAVVTKSVLPYTLVAGNPAKPIKRYDFASNDWVRIYEQ